MPVISISMTGELLDKLDALVKDSGYSSRSEAIRQIVREGISNHALTRAQKGWVTATATIIYNREEKNVNPKLSALRHEFDELISGNMHLHMGNNYCVEIFIIEGGAEKALQLLTKIRSIRDVQQVRYTMTPLEREE